MRIISYRLRNITWEVLLIRLSESYDFFELQSYITDRNRFNVYLVFIYAWFCSIQWNEWISPKVNNFLFWLIDYRPYSLIFISEYEMLPTFGERIELSHALRCHDITTSNGSIFRHISKVHCFISSLLHIKQYNMVHIIWFI